MYFIETLTSQSTNREFDNVSDALEYIRWALESNFKAREIVINGKTLERVITETGDNVDNNPMMPALLRRQAE